MIADFQDAPRPNDEVVYRDLAEGGVLLHLESGQYHGLNSTGSLIWKLIDGKRSVDEIAAALDGQVEDASENLRDEVVRFLTGLRARDLIV